MKRCYGCRSTAAGYVVEVFGRALACEACAAERGRRLHPFPRSPARRVRYRWESLTLEQYREMAAGLSRPITSDPIRPHHPAPTGTSDGERSIIDAIIDGALPRRGNTTGRKR